jgi:4-oxalocrotonate tautomerase
MNDDSAEDFAERPGSKGFRPFTWEARAIDRDDECPPRSDPYLLSTLRRANCSHTRYHTKLARERSPKGGPMLTYHWPVLCSSSVKTSQLDGLRAERRMPPIQVRLIEGVYLAKRKNEIIEKLTDAMVSTEGANMRIVTKVTIAEVRNGAWGIRGKALTMEAFRSE